MKKVNQNVLVILNIVIAVIVLLSLLVFYSINTIKFNAGPKSSPSAFAVIESDTPGITLVPSMTLTLVRKTTPTNPRTPTTTSTPYPEVIFRKGPYLIYSGDTTRMDVIWQLDDTENSTIEWGNNDQYLLGTATTAEYSTNHMHRYSITNLTPGTKYFYRVIVGIGESVGTFLSAPDSEAKDLKFFAFGDTRDGTEIHDSIDGQIIAAYTDDPAFQTFILSPGDIVSEGDLDWMWDRQLFDPKFKNIREVFANLSYLPVMGNHEGTGTLFKQYFTLPFVNQRYWSFDYGPAHIVMLDQYSPYKNGTDQYNWLKNDLTASHKTWKFILLHEPGWSASDNNMTVQRDILPLVEKYGVSIIFGGHNHYYARTEADGVIHLTVGGGGAPLYAPNPNALHVVTASRVHSFVEIEIQGNTLTGTAYDLDGNIIDQFSITK
jgi:hypothetical protein